MPWLLFGVDVISHFYTYSPVSQPYSTALMPSCPHAFSFPYIFLLFCHPHYSVSTFPLLSPLLSPFCSSIKSPHVIYLSFHLLISHPPAPPSSHLQPPPHFFPLSPSPPSLPSLLPLPLPFPLPTSSPPISSLYPLPLSPSLPLPLSSPLPSSPLSPSLLTSSPPISISLAPSQPPPLFHPSTTAPSTRTPPSIVSILYTTLDNSE